MPSLTPRALVRSRIRRSALLLDRDRPDWYRKINVPKFDMSDCTACVLGQLTDAKRKGLLWEGVLAEAGLDEHTACLRGFSLGDDLTDTEDVDYTHLEQAWLREIYKRRTADR